jgi:hypothetical protein
MEESARNLENKGKKYQLCLVIQVRSAGGGPAWWRPFWCLGS